MRERKTMDGNMAAAHVAYAFTELAVIYPITPSSPMADYTDIWALKGRKNLFGQPVLLTQMQSEAGVAGAMHGSLQAGALTTTFTSSQGLLLMLPNLYKMAGECLPGVVHVAARTIATHSLSIFGDQSDIFSCRQTGVAMLASGNVQEVMDLAAVAHMAAIYAGAPFLHFFDGFRTSHELQKIYVWDYETLAEIFDFSKVEQFRRKAMNPEHPDLRGTAQNPDVFFQFREAANLHYLSIPKIVEGVMEKVNSQIGTTYKLFEYYGAEDAEQIIVAMGSVCDTVEETIDYMEGKGEKAGLVKVRLYRPFSREHFLTVLPKSVKKIIVLNKTKEPGAPGDPLYEDVVTALQNSAFQNASIFSGRYGISSKDTTPEDILAAFHNTEKKEFTLGIYDDVTHLSLKPSEAVEVSASDCYACKFWGMGSDGTVGANKNSIKIIGDHRSLYVQAYFEYDSKKSGGVTISHLRFGKTPIRSAYLVHKADFIACHKPSYLEKYKIIEDLKEGGIFLLNSPWKEETLEEALPDKVKYLLAKKKARFYIINGFELGEKIGLGGRINTILQAAFFKLTGILPEKEAVQYMKEAVARTYFEKGEEVLQMNYQAIEVGMEHLKEIVIPEKWRELVGAYEKEDIRNQTEDKRDGGDTNSNTECTSWKENYVNQIQKPVLDMKGEKLPVSSFLSYLQGTIPPGTSSLEKRGIALTVPEWIPENCIQCNRCSFVCPHTTIRPVILKEGENQEVSADYPTVKMMGLEGYRFAISVSPLDCTGCGLCVSACPGKKGEKALAMRPIESQLEKQSFFNWGREKKQEEAVLEKLSAETVKGSQFRKPLLEFSGACAGCGESAYIRILTQLFGDRMYIANATGCSSIWGGSFPSSPYCSNEEGKGPVWANSLFEDNAEFGYGMALGTKVLDYQKENKEKHSHWIVGGDGWAYDIGYGGLDHVLASGEDVNIFVLDTEVYSNTGGQVSKATSMAAVAQFATFGKEQKKKDLAAMAMCYEDVYVAQIAMGADYNQTLRAIIEAESYPGPSLIIAYAPCINHGMAGGLQNGLKAQKWAVESGYWNLFRFDPRREEIGENPLVLDSPEPVLSLEDFLKTEVRFQVLKKTDPERAVQLFHKLETQVKKRYQRLKMLSS